VLAVGIDWAEEFHLVALGNPGEGVIEVLRVEHRPGAVSALVERIAGLEADPAEVRVVIETRHGLLVEALVEAGYTELPVNPELVSRRRGPARKKDDAEDARICCLLALDRHAGLRRLIPHGQVAGELRSIARDDERACRDERRLPSRLRADLIVTFPAALAIAGEDLGATRILRLLERWPTSAALAGASREEIINFGRAQRTGYLQRFADRIATALAEDRFTAPEHLARAKIDTIRLTARQLLLIDAQRRAWEKRMGELLLGTPGQLPEDQPGQAFPGGETYLSFPGLGRRLAARIAGEIGEHTGQFTTPNSLQCYAGRAPVTRRSGKRDLVVAHRLACNRYLADAVQQVGVRQPAPFRLGQGVLRRPARPRQEPPRGPASTRQPLARDPLALPHPRRAVRRNSPHRQPQPGSRRDHSASSLTPRSPDDQVIPDHGARGLTEDVSSWTPPAR
jgi:transposase